MLVQLYCINPIFNRHPQAGKNWVPWRPMKKNNSKIWTTTYQYIYMMWTDHIGARGNEPTLLVYSMIIGSLGQFTHLTETVFQMPTSNPCFTEDFILSHVTIFTISNLRFRFADVSFESLDHALHNPGRLDGHIPTCRYCWTKWRVATCPSSRLPEISTNGAVSEMRSWELVTRTSLAFCSGFNVKNVLPLCSRSTWA